MSPASNVLLPGAVFIPLFSSVYHFFMVAFANSSEAPSEVTNTVTSGVVFSLHSALKILLFQA